MDWLQGEKRKEIILSKNKQTNETTPEKVPVAFCMSQTSLAHKACVMGKWRWSSTHQLFTIKLQKQFFSESIDVHFISMNKGSSFTFSYIQKGNSP